MDRAPLSANGKAKHAPRGALTREQLEPLIEAGSTIREIAAALDRSVSTVRYWMEQRGLKTNSRRGRRPAVARHLVDSAIRAGRRTVTGDCRYHGSTVFVIEGSGRARCRQCRMDRVVARRRRVKKQLIEEAGGSCARCGYDRFVGALHFHHLAPSQKRFAVSKSGATIGIDTIRAEAAKCIVLCANCHAEVEHGGGALSVQ
jgi:hypothetical protein